MTRKNLNTKPPTQYTTRSKLEQRQLNKTRQRRNMAENEADSVKEQDNNSIQLETKQEQPKTQLKTATKLTTPH